ncbi:MAG: alpha-galactosidase [Brevinematales bacterium]|nr:alpha-galactosidase [Brevinematales bacterium]
MRILSYEIRYGANGAAKRTHAPLDLTAKETFQTLGGGLGLATRVTGIPGGIRFTLTLRADTPIPLHQFGITLEHHFSPDDKIFLNGYQSWSLSREVGAFERAGGLNPLFAPFTRLFRLKYYGDYFFAKYKNGRGQFHSYTYTYIRTPGGAVSLAGSLSERAGYTVFRFDTRRGRLEIVKDCEGMTLEGETVLVDIVLLDGTLPEMFDRYFNMTKPHRDMPPAQTGWTSWYYHYEKIDEKIILDNLREFARRNAPIDIFQIDDGYQKAVGDWLETNEKFPRGMKPIADEIRKAGYRAGLWLAPFIAEEKSSIVRDHPDWLKTDTRGERILAGYNPFNWSGNFYALDLCNPDVREYLRGVFDTVLYKWGFGMVKLDFLYAAALSPSCGRSRGQLMTECMEFIRECAGESWVLGCGMPLGPGFGQVDFCRIGSDVALSWQGEHYKFLGVQTKITLEHFRFRERVSIYNSLISTIGRQALNGRAFMNDPDVFILRTPYQWLTPEEKKTLYLLNQIFGGLVFTSDNIGEYDAEQLALYMRQFPFREKQIDSCVMDGGLLRAEFRIGKLEYTVASNMGDTPCGAALDGHYAGGAELYDNPVFILAPHETRVFLRIPRGDYAVIGSDCHIFPGSEIESVQVTPRGVTLRRTPLNTSNGTIVLRAPTGKKSLRVNGSEYAAEESQFGGVVRVSVNPA